MDISINKKLNLLHDRFAAWKKKSPYLGDDECPDWKNVLVLIKGISNAEFLSNQSIDMVLFFLGKDEETEELLEILKEKPTLGHSIAKKGIEKASRSIRWQSAVLLGYFRDKQLLTQIAKNDLDEYVRRRALLALREIDHLAAEEVSLKRLYSEDAYERKVALDTLFYLKSPELPNAIGILEKDSAEIVQARLKSLQLESATKP